MSSGTVKSSRVAPIWGSKEINVWLCPVSIPFVTPVNTSGSFPKSDVDGLLPTVLFQRDFVDYTDHYVVLDPW